MNTPVISSWSVYPGPSGDFDDMAAPPSRFLNVCGDFAMTPSFSTFGQDLNIFDDGVQKLSQSETTFYGTQKKDDYYINSAHFDHLTSNNPILIVNNPTAAISAPSPIVTYSSQTSNSVTENPLMTIHSPTPSLITDDDQDHHHHNQEALCREYQKNLPNEVVFQSRSPTAIQNGLQNDKNVLNGRESLKNPSQNDGYGTSTKKSNEHLSSVKSDDGNELNSTQLTPPPSHQTTPTQKKRRVNNNKKVAVNDNQDTTDDTLISSIEEESTMSNISESPAYSPSTRNTNTFISGNKKRAAEDTKETAEEKRRKFLERNRIAASKCRQKKKAWVQDLKNKADSIIAKNNQLHAFVNDLKEEMLSLKNQLLAHRNCDCNILQEYIKNGGHSSFERYSAQPYNS